MSPFKSQAQKEKLMELMQAGKITPQEFKRLEMETGNNPLPDRIHPKKEETTVQKFKRHRVRPR